MKGKKYKEQLRKCVKFKTCSKICMYMDLLDDIVLSLVCVCDYDKKLTLKDVNRHGWLISRNDYRQKLKIDTSLYFMIRLTLMISDSVNQQTGWKKYKFNCISLCEAYSYFFQLWRFIHEALSLPHSSDLNQLLN